MHCAACQNQIEIRPAGRYIKRSQRHVAAKDTGPAPAVAGMLSSRRQPRAKARLRFRDLHLSGGRLAHPARLSLPL